MKPVPRAVARVSGCLGNDVGQTQEVSLTGGRADLRAR